MNGIKRIMLLGAAAILTVAGYLSLGRVEDVGVTFLCFLAAGLFLYLYFGKSKLFSSFTDIREYSKAIILGKSGQKPNKWSQFRIGMLTFSIIVLCFSVGFGVGKTIYHVVN